MAAASLAPSAMAGSISGTVADANGGPLGGIAVNTRQVGARAFEPGVETDSAGHYTIPDLGPGQWKVEFGVSTELPGRGANYLPEWYDNQPTEAAAAAITIMGDEAVTGIDAALAQGGTMSGTITEEGNPAPLSSCVSVSTGQGAEDYTAQTLDGNFRITGLPTGNYFVVFSACDFDANSTGYDGAVPECFNNVTPANFRKPWKCGAGATLVPVVAGQDVVGINASVQYFAKPDLFIKGGLNDKLNLTAKLSAEEAASVALTGRIEIKRGPSYDFKDISAKLKPGKTASDRLAFTATARRAAKKAFDRGRSVFINATAIFTDNSGLKYKGRFVQLLCSRCTIK